VLVGEVSLRADGAGRGGFAKCSGMAKALASAALRGIAERDVLADVAFPVEKQHLGVPQLGGADKSDDHGGGGLALCVREKGKKGNQTPWASPAYKQLSRNNKQPRTNQRKDRKHSRDINPYNDNPVFPARRRTEQQPEEQPQLTHADNQRDSRTKEISEPKR
jgi:hypothetical protein